MSTIRNLTAKANQYRWNTALGVVKSLEKKEKPDLTSLRAPASGPLALGFSNSDLCYFRNRFASRIPEYTQLREEAMAFVKKMNAKASHNDGRLRPEDRSRRDAAYKDATWAGSRLRAVEAFSEIVTMILEERETAAKEAEEHRQAIIAAALADVKAKREAALVEAQKTVAVVQQAPAPLPCFKPKKYVKKVAQARGEVRLDSFEALKELQENSDTARLQAEIAAMDKELAA
jgi:hypothetical protein